jgi:hypothetical protein
MVGGASLPPVYRQYLTRDRMAFVASVVLFLSRWYNCINYAAPASTMGEALCTTRNRVIQNDTRKRAPDASMTPGLVPPRVAVCAGAGRATGARTHAEPAYSRSATIHMHVLIQFGALCHVTLPGWRFPGPRGAF